MSIKKVLGKLSNKLFLKSLLTFGLRGFGVLFLFGFTMLMTRNFDPNRIGEYELVRVFLLIVGSIALLGTDVSIIYFSGRLKGEHSFHSIKGIYYKIVKIVCACSIALVLFFYLLKSINLIDVLFNENGFYILKYVVLILPFYALTILNTEVFRAIDHVVLSELFRNFFKYVPLFIGVLFLFYHPNSLFSLAEYFAYGFIFLFFITQIILYFLFKQIKTEREMIIYTSSEIIHHSFPMGVSNIIMFLLLGIDVFLLKRYYGDTTVAFYSIAIKLITILSIVILSITINCAPKISEYHIMNNKKLLQDLCRKTARITLGINLIVAIVMLVFLDTILSMFGSEYTSMKSTFYILIISQLVTSALGVVPIYLNMTGRSKVYQNILFCTLVFNLLMNLYLIPILSTIGAAITFSCSVILWNILVVLYVYKKDKIKLFFI